MLRNLCLLLALLFSPACGGCGVLEFCSQPPPSAHKIATSSPGSSYATIDVADDSPLPLTVLENPHSGICHQPPLQPIPPILGPGDSATLAGDLSTCTSVILELTYENRLAQTCSYLVAYDGTAVTVTGYQSGTGGDTDCFVNQTGPVAWSIGYNAWLGSGG